jgi:hypothetical protein
MTLAFILFVGFLGVSPRVTYTALPASQTQSAPDQQTAKPPQNPPSTPAENSAQGTTGKSQSGNAPKSTPPPAQAAKKPRKGLRKSSVNCEGAATTKGSKPNNATDAASKTSASTAVSPCPPKKVIVRQGSTAETSIEVVGGAEGRQASDERNTALQMLETTEANLKKMEGMQLNSSQQDMVNQVREFMDQSKAATSAGDLDQARTLAWKAQLLSEDLLKTQK